ncbi:hypothetical protein [Lachnoclostridium sp. An131]|uniref:hypothetical protein n=1 Tax=Lachnoclostridium sp. An131 TaxID=1965555 RepID=UPI0013A68238|nr:hypothetical protein [Lachnoclostridium sp. An131]
MRNFIKNNNIECELKGKPHLFEFMKMAVNLSEAEIKQATEMLCNLKGKKGTMA